MSTRRSGEVELADRAHEVRAVGFRGRLRAGGLPAAQRARAARRPARLPHVRDAGAGSLERRPLSDVVRRAARRHRMAGPPRRHPRPRALVRRHRQHVRQRPVDLAQHAGRAARDFGVTHFDNVAAQDRLLREALGVDELALVYGWSMGAQQAYHWAALHPGRVRRVAALCGTARTSPHNAIFLRSLEAALTGRPGLERRALHRASPRAASAPSRASTPAGRPRRRSIARGSTASSASPISRTTCCAPGRRATAAATPPICSRCCARGWPATSRPSRASAAISRRRSAPIRAQHAGHAERHRPLLHARGLRRRRRRDPGRPAAHHPVDLGPPRRQPVPEPRRTRASSAAPSRS